jgi:hypothetical protein
MQLRTAVRRAHVFGPRCWPDIDRRRLGAFLQLRRVALSEKTIVVHLGIDRGATDEFHQPTTRFIRATHTGAPTAMEGAMPCPRETFLDSPAA